MSAKLIIRELLALLECAKLLGLPQADIDFAHDLVEHYEFGVCLEHIATQLYEYDIPITESLYSFIGRIEAKLDLSSDELFYLKKLIDGNLPERIKDEIEGIISQLSV
jgi:hypothetical protein